jgi:hypothetical protein
MRIYPNFRGFRGTAPALTIKTELWRFPVQRKYANALFSRKIAPSIFAQLSLMPKIFKFFYATHKVESPR